MQEQIYNEKACPKCGANMEGPGEFCTNCGYSVYDPNNDIGRHAAFKVFPVVLYCLFAPLLFAFFAAPLDISGMNLYQLFGIASSIGGTVPAEIKCLIALASIATAIAILYTVLHFVMKDEKQKIKLHRAFMIYSLLMYLCLLITSAVIIGDAEGMASACPIIVLILSCILMLVNVFCFFAEIGSADAADKVEKY